MKRRMASFLCLLRRDESGAVFILVAIGIVAILGLGALAVDVGKLAYKKRQLQASTDFAAAAGALEIFSTSYSATAAAIAYTATTNKNNAQPGPNVSIPTGYPHLAALNGSSGGGCPSAAQLVTPNYPYPPCTASNAFNPSANAVVVRQQMTVSLTLGEIFHMGPVTLTATALALARGPGPTPPLNVMIVVDTTGSMNSSDPNGTAATCGTNHPTKIQCAMFGARQLMDGLVAAQDYVGLMVYPPLNTNTTNTCGPHGTSSCGGAPVSNDYDCSATTQPVVEAYNASSPTYQVVGLSNNYQNSNGSPNNSSNLVTAAQGPSNCAGISVIAGEGTYFTAAIAAAQSALTSFSSHQAGVQNIMVLLSDGGAGNGNGAPVSNQCNSAITAAHTAAGAGIWVYSVAYGSSTTAGSCSDPETAPIANVTACQTMQDIASSPGLTPNPSLFFSDGSTGTGTCPSVNPASDLGTIFTQIAHSLTHTVVIPCGTTQAGGYC
jgi:Flp pilus assembly protein TadG